MDWSTCARFYDSSSGRFLDRDPFAGMAVAPQSLNCISYVLDNPVNKTDPSGIVMAPPQYNAMV